MGMDTKGKGRGEHLGCEFSLPVFEVAVVDRTDDVRVRVNCFLLVMLIIIAYW